MVTNGSFVVTWHYKDSKNHMKEFSDYPCAIDWMKRKMIAPYYHGLKIYKEIGVY